VVNDPADRTTILIVDDHALLREGLRGILEAQEDMRVVGEAGDSATTLVLAAREQPHIVLLDIEIPGEEVTITVSQIRDCSPGSRVIILSMYEGPQLVQALLAVGVRGYLLKSIHWQELVVAIRAVRADSDRLVLGVSTESLRYVRQEPGMGKLSAREREIIGLVGEALSNGQIASRLSLTEATVKRHLRNIFVKLGAVSRIDAVNKAGELQRHQFASHRRLPEDGGLAVLERILPTPVVAVEAFEDSHAARLFPEEEAVIVKAVAKRRAEFTTARACARAALARLGVPPAPILPGHRGAPRWPDGVVGSITHCDGYRAVAVARFRDVATLGLDAEPNEPLPEGVLDTIALEKERARLAELTATKLDVCWDRLLFSAKESVYKAWFPLALRWLGFESADITVDPCRGAFTARLLVPGPLVAGSPLTVLHGRWLADRGLLVTAIAVPAASPG
jgi:4'-phosphopantetheinyl transferase EntD/DNA-binding NarL/FixJ family response regulator